METKTKRVPTSAFRCSTDGFELGENGEKAKTAPFRMTARNRGPIDHWFWGRIVHDFEGMQFGANGKNRIPIDYAHDDREIIGFANHFSTEDDLRISGSLVPFKDSDRATEIIHKSRHGVPYQSSIFFEADSIEEIPQGETVEVNGEPFTGPGVVVREWTLRGCAICPHGADSNTETSTALSADKQEMIEVKIMQRKSEGELSAALLEEDETIDIQESQEVKTISCRCVEEEDEAEATVDGEEPVSDSVESGPASDELDVRSDVETQLESTPVDGQRFLDSFGDRGGVWFAQGKSFAEATELFISELRTENEALRQRLATASQIEGEDSPASFSSAENSNKKRLSECWS